MFKFDKDDFFNYLVATDQLDDFLGKKKEEVEEKEEYDDDDDNDNQENNDEQG